MKLKSLQDIAKNNELPIKVTYSTGTVYVLLCIGDNNIACTHTERMPDKIIRQTSDLKQWELWKEPKPIKHYPALYTNGRDSNVKYSISKTLFADESSARQGITSGSKFIRLVTEYPAVMLTPIA